MNINKAIEKFLEWGSVRYGFYTIRNYRQWLSKFVNYIGNKKIQDITIDDIIKYSHNISNQNYSDSYVAYHLIALRQFWKFLFDNREVTMTYELINVPKYDQNSFVPVTRDQVNSMIVEIEKEGDGFKQYRDKCILAMLYATGVRVSELCDLTVNDLHLADRYATIKNKKNRKKRMIFWDIGTEALLLMYLDLRGEIAQDDYIFISLDRRSENQFKKLSVRSVERIVEKYRKKAGIKEKITPHSFRHGFASDCVKQGQHPRHTQKLLGHQDISSSQVYMDVADMDLKEAYKKFAKDR